jgi:hypothetical protein
MPDVLSRYERGEFKSVRARHLSDSQHGMIAATLANMPQGSRTRLYSYPRRY